MQKTFANFAVLQKFSLGCGVLWHNTSEQSMNVFSAKRKNWKSFLPQKFPAIQQHLLLTLVYLEAVENLGGAWEEADLQLGNGVYVQESLLELMGIATIDCCAYYMVVVDSHMTAYMITSITQTDWLASLYTVNYYTPLLVPIPLPGFHTEGGCPGIPAQERIDGNIISIMNVDGHYRNIKHA